MSPQVLEQVQAVRARLAQRAGQPESAAARYWREMSLQTRTLLVMLSSSQAGDPRTIAGQAWEQFSPSDRAAIGACARQIQKDTARAERLR